MVKSESGQIWPDLRGMTYLQLLNKLFQKEGLKVSEAFNEIEMTIQSLQGMVNSEARGNNKDLEFPVFHNIELTALYGLKLENMKKKNKELHQSFYLI